MGRAPALLFLAGDVSQALLPSGDFTRPLHAACFVDPLVVLRSISSSCGS
jgi:hypothetical protein